MYIIKSWKTKKRNLEFAYSFRFFINLFNFKVLSTMCSMWMSILENKSHPSLLMIHFLFYNDFFYIHAFVLTTWDETETETHNYTHDLTLKANKDIASSTFDTHLSYLLWSFHSFDILSFVSFTSFFYSIVLGIFENLIPIPMFHWVVSSVWWNRKKNPTFLMKNVPRVSYDPQPTPNESNKNMSQR